MDLLAQALARRIYHVTPEPERDAKKKRLEKILSVSERTIHDWLSRIDKDSKAARNKRIFYLWLACWTQREIAEEVKIKPGSISGILLETADLPKPVKSAAEHSDFEPELYDVWKQQSKSNGTGHFGNSEVRWLDNLLYRYTKTFGVVVDPFASGGSTVGVEEGRRGSRSERKALILI